jgi:hypothetical protein
VMGAEWAMVAEKPMHAARAKRVICMAAAWPSAAGL